MGLIEDLERKDPIYISDHEYTKASKEYRQRNNTLMGKIRGCDRELNALQSRLERHIKKYPESDSKAVQLNEQIFEYEGLKESLETELIDLAILHSSVSFKHQFTEWLRTNHGIYSPGSTSTEELDRKWATYIVKFVQHINNIWLPRGVDISEITA